MIEVKLFSVYSRAQDLFKIKDFLDVVDLFFPRLSSTGVSVLPSHGAASPVRVRPTLRERRDAKMGKRSGKGGWFCLQRQAEAELNVTGL